MIRHLLYSVYAAKKTDDWLLNVRELCKYKAAFNGWKVIVVRSDENAQKPEMVEAAFRKCGMTQVEFVHVKNDPLLGETPHFIEQLETFAPAGEDEILFYAHTKGVSYGIGDTRLTKIRNWRNVMYRENLTYISEVEELLKLYSCAGIFRIKAIIDEAPDAKWHYSGTFWWVSLRKLFAQHEWKIIDKNRYGVEAYLGSKFPLEQSCCLAFDGTTPWKNRSFFDLKLTEPIPSITVIIPTIGQAHLEKVLQQVHEQLGEHDEILVCGDGPCERAQYFAHMIDDPRIRYLEYSRGPCKDCGHTVRNWAMQFASKSHLYFIDDDDDFLEGGMEAIRRGIKEDPYKIQVFRIHHRNRVIWNEKDILRGNVSTQMLVVPNIKELLGTWGPLFRGDFDFLHTTVELHPKRERGIAWREEIIAVHGISKNRPFSDRRKKNHGNDCSFLTGQKC
jgi:hypothetical protein